LGGDTDIRSCHCDVDATPQPVWLGRATFKLGAPEDAWFRGQPALGFGVRTTILPDRTATHTRVAEAFLVASRALGPVQLHAGASVTDATDERSEGATLGKQVRPLGGFQWTPHQYPRTTVMGDVTWVPLLTDTLRREWVAGWGVRYQAFTWGSIELGGRNRQAEGIGDTRFFLRMNVATR
ncbi:MAG: hypothetical protein H0T79_11235, partial [Deltaproteobacteria bacterium]|nr:hypothetical protein [Deltaproteobacteria bacterium]